ncbi:MAG TPA: M28 family peptidase [Candidatus Dormibacteraeota bacterium]|nr:M28 family peptidase [Candidatus Dormibacteraeota bacterium]
MRRLNRGSAMVLWFALAAVTRGMNAHAQVSAGKMIVPPYAQAALSGISPERIRAHVRFLSSDLLDGRGTGQRGGEIAADYIATQFALAGVQPAGEDGTYLQKVPMIGVRTLPETTFGLAPQNGEALSLKWLDDFVTNNQSQTQNAEIDAPVIFVGYGIEAPEYKWDDYKGADVRGKVLLMLVNEPPSEDETFFKGKALTYYGRWTYKFEEAARRGAVGALLIHRTDMASYGWNVVRSSWSTERSYLKVNDKPKLQAASWVQLEVARKLVGLAGLDLDKLMDSAKSPEFRPVPLAVNVKAHIVSQLRPFEASNVLGIVPGRGPEATREAVLYTAHYDHLGIVHGAQGDNIYHGAVDNGTGCGILLELARAYASLPSRPPRSVLLAAVTGEEQGLLGSEYLGEHPPIPRSKIVLDLNFDAVAPIGDPEEVEVSGAERTTFYPAVEEIARTFGVHIRADAHPENGYYYRSDHFSLARVGIPSFSINEGQKFAGHTAEWGEQQSQDYTAHRYHQPSDEYKADMDFAGVAKIARFGFALGWKAAAQRRAIAWQRGDEFEAARKNSQASNH